MVAKPQNKPASGLRWLLIVVIGLLVLGAVLFAMRMSILHQYLRATDPEYAKRNAPFSETNTAAEMLSATYLDSACGNRLERLRLMHRVGVRSPDNDPYSPLQCAVEAGHLDTVRELVTLAGSADIVPKERHFKKLVPVTPLQLAAYRGNLAMVELLLSLRADPNMQPDDGKTTSDSAVRIAARQGHFDVLAALIKAGGDSTYLGTPLPFDIVEGAISANADKKIDWEALLDKTETLGLSIKSESADQRTLLHVAASQGQMDLVDILLKRGLNPEKIDKKGVLPFMYLVYWYAGNINVEPGPEFEATLAKLTHDIADINHATTWPLGEVGKKYSVSSGWTVATAAVSKPRLMAVFGEQLDYGRVDERNWPFTEEAQARAFIAKISVKQLLEAKTLAAGLRWAKLTALASEVEKRQAAMH
jgi:ankyrin repeat protein